MVKVWESKESSFALIRKTEGSITTLFILLAEIQKLAELISADINKSQIRFIADYILENYWYFTVSDITALTAQLVREKPYGKPMLQNIIVSIDEWDIARQDFAITQREKESSKIKSDVYSQTEIAEVYLNLKKKNENKLTRKEKDKVAQLKNQERIDEMKLLYPNK